MTNKRNAFEIATWPCSEEYVKDQSIIRSAFETLDGQPGLDEIFYGIEVEKSKACGILGWHTMDAHESFAADKERLDKFVEMFKTSAKDGVPQAKMFHASWEVSAAVACLRAPVTEIWKVKAREGVTLSGVQAVLDKYVKHVKQSTDEGVGATYGQVIENSKEMAVIIGWKSIEGRKEGKEEKVEIREMTDEIEEMSVLLTEY